MRKTVTRLSKQRPESVDALARRYLRAGDAVVDVGAADGEYVTLWAEAVGPTGSVLAIEPHPISAAACRDRHAERPWVQVHECAVGAHLGSLPLYSDQEHPRCSSLWAANVDHPGPSYPVSMTTLDDIVPDSLTPRLIKIDAQGAEAEILRGAMRLLTQGSLWVIELWPMGLAHAGASLSEIFQPFRRAGYVPNDVWGHAITWDRVERQSAWCVGYSSLDVVFLPGVAA